MKKNSILSLFAFATFSVQAQEKTNKDTTSIQPNRFVIEFTTGQSKGLNPYTEGYFSNNNEKAFGSIVLNSINLGFRYMISPTFGVKADIGYLDLKNNKKSISLPFEMQVYTFGVQGVINASKLFNIEKPLGRLGLLLHGGVQISQMNSKTSNEISGTNPITIVRNHNSGLKE